MAWECRMANRSWPARDDKHQRHSQHKCRKAGIYVWAAKVIQVRGAFNGTWYTGCAYEDLRLLDSLARWSLMPRLVIHSI